MQGSALATAGALTAERCTEGDVEAENVGAIEVIVGARVVSDSNELGAIEDRRHTSALPSPCSA